MNNISITSTGQTSEDVAALLNRMYKHVKNYVDNLKRDKRLASRNNGLFYIKPAIMTTDLETINVLLVYLLQHRNNPDVARQGLAIFRYLNVNFETWNEFLSDVSPLSNVLFFAAHALQHCKKKPTQTQFALKMLSWYIPMMDYDDTRVTLSGRTPQELICEKIMYLPKEHYAFKMHLIQTLLQHSEPNVSIGTLLTVSKFHDIVSILMKHLKALKHLLDESECICYILTKVMCEFIQAGEGDDIFRHDLGDMVKLICLTQPKNFPALQYWAAYEKNWKTRRVPPYEECHLTFEGPRVLVTHTVLEQWIESFPALPQVFQPH